MPAVPGFAAARGEAHPHERPSDLIEDLLAGQVLARPDAVAVRTGDQVMTYAELDRRSAQLANLLRDKGVGPEQLVAVMLPRSPELIVALLAILRAGAAYVPLDPVYPADRITYVLADSGAPLLVTSTHVGTGGWADDGRAICLDDESTIAALFRQPTTTPGNGARPDNLAYVVYTSGSTGRPKGAMVERRSLANYVRWFVDEFDLRDDDRMLASSSPSFDAFGIEVYPALAAGGMIVLLPSRAGLDPAEMLSTAAAQGVTVLATVPTVLRLIVDHPALASCMDIRQVMCGGEQLTGEVARRLFGRVAVPLRNLYGPTEATIDVAFHTQRPTSAPPDPVPIGRPVAGATLYVLDEVQRPVPEGDVGELYAGGVPVGRGYWGRPAETAAAFRPDPFGPAGSRMYATGDQVVRLPGGDLRYEGRLDSQIKLRGHRIELGEIEATLRGAAGVSDALVLHRADRRGVAQLVAYVVAQPGNGVERRVLAVARAALPAYMVPATVVAVAGFPRLPNGKLDAAALPPPDAPRPRPEASTAELSTVANVLLRAFREILGDDAIGPDDSFFEFGGDSISAIEVLVEARAHGIEVGVSDILRHETVRALVQHIGDGDAGAGPPIITRHTDVPLTPNQRWLLDQERDDVTSVHQYCAFELIGEIPAAALQSALDDVVQAHDALRLRVYRRGGRWHQQVAAAVPPVQITEATLPLGTVDLLAGPPADLIGSLLPQYALDAPPLLRAALVASGPRRLLLLSAHHLGVDAVSWRVIGDHLRWFLGQSGGGRPSRSSFADYAVRFAEAAARGAFDAEVPFWKERDCATAPALTLPGDADGHGHRTSVRQRYRPDPSGPTLRDLAAGWGVQVRDVLLGELVAAIRSVTGGDACAVETEGHGREPLGGPDVFRTVGWFTAVFPLVVNAPEDVEGAELAAAVRRTFDELPRSGVGFGALRHLSANVHGLSSAAPDVSFNYLGRSARTASAGCLRPVGWPVQVHGRTDERGSRLLAVNAALVEDDLLLEVVLPASRTGPAGRAWLVAERYQRQLERLFGYAPIGRGE